VAIEEYKASNTLRKFHRSDAFVRLVVGPIGSGKSVACVIEILRRACKQTPNSEKVRKSRWLIVRNTYTELKDTTIRTFFDWIPREMGYWNEQNKLFRFRFAPGDGTIVDLEVLFRALDLPSDVRKLLSLELTGAWLNEARELGKPVLDMLIGRVGRYPSRREVDRYWHGVILDTNPCDVDHWIYKSFEENKAPTWDIFHQPSGLSPDAENRENLPATYYEQMLPGKTAEWIKVYVHGQWGFVADGKPVYPEYNDDIHVADHILTPVPGETIYVGMDFGLTPAATISQIIDGQRRVIDEVTTERMGALNFGKVLGKLLRSKYDGYPLEMYGDPAGSSAAQTDEMTPFLILQSQGLFASPAPSNDWDVRREAVASQLTELLMTGEPAMLISPACKMLRKGMGGGYKLRRVQISGEERFHEKPDKQSQYSHVCDADQYAVLGCGLGFKVLGYTKDWDTPLNGTKKAKIGRLGV
jgi:hypothetical protein